MGDPRVWFGNLTKATWLPAPRRGMDAGSAGRTEKIELANGGSFVSQSNATHREYSMEWGALEHDEIKPLYHFRNGLYGSGLLYFCDPWMANVFPPHWAEPGLTTQDWPSLYAAGITPTAVPGGLASFNYMRSPQPNAGGWATSGPTIATQTLLADSLGEPYARYDRLLTTAYAARVNYNVNTLPASPVNATVQVRGTNPTGTIVLAIRKGTSTTNLSSITMPAGWLTGEWQTITGPSYTPVGGADYSLHVLSSAGVAGNFLEVRRAGIMTAGVPYFYGGSRFLDGRTVAWTGTEGDSSSTTIAPIPGVPTTSALYTLQSPLGTNLPARAAVMLVPPTKTLWLGVSGSATNGAGVYARGILPDGSISVPMPLTLLAPESATLMNASFNGSEYTAVVVYLDTTAVGSSTITLNNSMAVYTNTGTTPTLTGLPVPGEGHTGMRFQGNILRTYINERGVNGTQLVSAACSLTEVGAWI